MVTAAVSVTLADVHAATLVAALTSVAVEPIVSAVAPLSGMPGTVTALTVAGRGLAGATALTFLRDNAADASVTATNLSVSRSEEHTSELQSLAYLVCRLLLEKKKKTMYTLPSIRAS